MTASDLMGTEPQPWRRLSGRMLLIHPVRETIRAFPALLGALFLGSSGGNGHWWSLGALTIVVALSIMRWFTTRYRITPEQVQLRTGLFRRRTMATPLDRVRTVDVSADALQRVLGLAKVVIGTGTSDRKKQALVLDGLPTADAGRLRADLLHRKRDAHAVATTAEPVERELARLHPAWVRYAPFTLSGALTALAAVGIAWNVSAESGLGGHAVDSTTGYLQKSSPWLAAAQGAVAALLLVSVLGIIGYVLAFWNFRLTRHPSGTVHVQRGLFTNRATSISEQRLCGAELSEPLLLRLAGGARVLAIATGLRVGRGGERGGSMLLPPAPAAEARRVAALLVADPTAISCPLRRHGLRAGIRRFTRTITPCALLTLVLGAAWRYGDWPGWLPAVSLVPLALAPVVAIDRYRGLGHAVCGRYLVTRFGSLARRRNVLDTEAIIGWNLDQSFFQRRAGLVTLTATTAAGKQGYPVLDLGTEHALELMAAATPGLLDPFTKPPPADAVYRAGHAACASP